MSASDHFSPVGPTPLEMLLSDRERSWVGTRHPFALLHFAEDRGWESDARRPVAAGPIIERGVVFANVGLRPLVFSDAEHKEKLWYTPSALVPPPLWQPVASLTEANEHFERQFTARPHTHRFRFFISYEKEGIDALKEFEDECVRNPYLEPAPTRLGTAHEGKVLTSSFISFASRSRIVVELHQISGSDVGIFVGEIHYAPALDGPSIAALNELAETQYPLDVPLDAALAVQPAYVFTAEGLRGEVEGGLEVARLALLFEDSAECTAYLLEVLSGEDQDERAAAFAVAAHLELAPVLEKGLADPDEALRNAAKGALEEMNEPAAAPVSPAAWTASEPFHNCYFGAAELDALRDHARRLKENVGGLLCKMWPFAAEELDRLTPEQFASLGAQSKPYTKIKLELGIPNCSAVLRWADRFDCSVSRVVHVLAELGEKHLDRL